MSDEHAVDVLLVEDNPQDMELTIRALKKRNLANRVFVVDDGAQALDFVFGRGVFVGRAHANLPRVVLLDLKLPKVDGLEVLKEMRANERTHRVPVVMVTSSREDPDIERAYQLGANSYVVKPVSFDAFVEVMSNLGFYWLLINQAPR